MLHKNLAIGLIVFFSSLQAGTASAIGFQIIPDRPGMNIGESVTVDVWVNDLGNFIAPSVSVYEIDLTYLPGLFVPGPVNFGDQLDPFLLGDIRDAVPIADSVRVTEISFELPPVLEMSQPDSFRLFSVDFIAIMEGTGYFNLAVSVLGDAWGDPLPFSLPDRDEASVEVVQPSNVPVPAAAWLFGTALLGFVGVSRRKKKA